jgi:hypothetical protein
MAFAVRQTVSVPVGLHSQCKENGSGFKTSWTRSAGRAEYGAGTALAA